jgi:Trypsin-co-occurring domain 2
MPEEDALPLVEIIRALSRELREAERKASDDPILQLKDCSIELGITWERSAEGGLQFYVFKLGGHANKANSQTITVNLSPLREVRVGRPAEVRPD